MNKFPDYSFMLLYNECSFTDDMLDCKDYVYRMAARIPDIHISDGTAHACIMSNLRRVLRLNHV